MVTTLYLIRHGAVEGSGVKRYNGSIDVPLSQDGASQVEAASAFVSSHLAGHAASKRLSYLRDIHTDADKPGLKAAEDHHPRLSAIYCSDLSRSLRSAQIVGAAHGLTPAVRPGLRERSFGIWEGLTFPEIKDRYPEEFRRWAGNPLKYCPPGGENTLEVRDRVIAAIERIKGAHEGQSVAVVAHGGVNRIVLCHVLGVPLEHIFRIEQDFAAVNIIDFWEKYPVVKLLNFAPWSG
jgi:broad specificity phosphatase PhoE